MNLRSHSLDKLRQIVTTGASTGASAAAHGRMQQLISQQQIDECDSVM
jgi:hypothetical protein